MPDTRAWRLERVQGQLAACRGAARVAQGGADRDHLRLRLAGRAPRGRRAAARRVDRVRRRGRADDRVERAAQHARRAAPARCSPRTGTLFVRADLGQIEPRVLAAVSGDSALAAATAADDMYLPVAAELGVDRPTAKVAMIAAMYGQTTGHGGEAARRMRAAYPVAMGYLDAADRSARAGPGPAHLRRPAAADVRRRQRRRPAAGTGATRSSRARRPSCSRCGR